MLNFFMVAHSASCHPGVYKHVVYDVLPYNVLITFYNALMLPHLTYGVLAWAEKGTESCDFIQI